MGPDSGPGCMFWIGGNWPIRVRRSWGLGVLTVVVTILASACAPRTAKLYSVDTGAALLELHYRGGLF